jgi:hypothetical protein
MRFFHLLYRLRANDGAVDRLRDGVSLVQKSLAEDLRASVQELYEKVREGMCFD